MTEIECANCNVPLTGIRTVFYDRLFSLPFCSEYCLRIHFVDNIDLVIDTMSRLHVEHNVDLIDNK